MTFFLLIIRVVCWDMASFMTMKALCFQMLTVTNMILTTGFPIFLFWFKSFADFLLIVSRLPWFAELNFDFFAKLGLVVLLFSSLFSLFSNLFVSLDSVRSEVFCYAIWLNIVKYRQNWESRLLRAWISTTSSIVIFKFPILFCASLIRLR